MAASKGTVSDVPVKILKLVVVGKTGVGKSSSGNTILGKEVFPVASNLSSVTIECSEQSKVVFNWFVTVVDTPGIFDTHQTDDAVRNAIKSYFTIRNEKPNTVLFVMEPGSFTEEDEEAVKKVEEIFGNDVWKRAVILFTHGDEVDDDFDDNLKKALDNKDGEFSNELRRILDITGRRYHVFDNTKMENLDQVQNLLLKVQKMMDTNEQSEQENTLSLSVEGLRIFETKQVEIKAVSAEMSETPKPEEKLKSFN